MRKIEVNTTCRKMLGDVSTPVGIYLRVRDRFRDTILLESTDSHSSENSWSFICINAIAGMEMIDIENCEFKLPGKRVEKLAISHTTDMARLIKEFMEKFEFKDNGEKEKKYAQGLYGYTAYDAVNFFENIPCKKKSSIKIPLIRYRLYQYVIAINHFRDELFICENEIDGINPDGSLVEALTRSKDVPLYPFAIAGIENSVMSDDQYIEVVKKGIAHCLRGDVFQMVVSRGYQQRFTGDEFNVYRALRSINPSPYLFFFDYGDYKLFGSSPEAQLQVRGGFATVHPIAGTYRRTGDDEADRLAAAKLQQDPKENAEHVMLVDLARNDLSRFCTDVQVSHYKQLQFFSHVIHLVSEVKGRLQDGTHPYQLLTATFPAGTLSGAPKVKAMELINKYEPDSRGYYGGAIGFIGFDGSCNHAIMIRTFLSRQNKLFYQAGAGIVAASVPGNELQEVKNKLGALKKALEVAKTI